MRITVAIILSMLQVALALPALAAQVAPAVPPGTQGAAAQVQQPRPFIPDVGALTVPPPQQQLAYTVIIENKAGGVIRIVDPPAQFVFARPGVDIGTVVRPATLLNTESFHASLWGKPGTVVASAVNAIHLKAYDVAGIPRAAVITLLPKELLETELDGSKARLRDDQLYTDIRGGHGIFGGAYPLIVGNPVTVLRDMRRITFSAAQPSLRIGDVLLIQVQTPLAFPRELVFHNQPGGTVDITDASGAKTTCGTMEKTVSGTGRFAGGLFCASGGIRATHTGVLDIDFSPPGLLGGMQIIPHAHSLSPELTYSQESPPYGIVLGPGGSDMRGQAPIYSGYLYPQSGLEAPVLLPRLRISVQFADYLTRGGDAVVISPGPSPWLELPTLTGREDISDLQAIRIEWLAPQAAAGADQPQSAELPDTAPAKQRRYKLPRSFRPPPEQAQPETR